MSGSQHSDDRSSSEADAKPTTRITRSISRRHASDKSEGVDLSELSNIELKEEVGVTERNGFSIGDRVRVYSKKRKRPQNTRRVQIQNAERKGRGIKRKLANVVGFTVDDCIILENDDGEKIIKNFYRCEKFLESSSSGSDSDGNNVAKSMQQSSSSAPTGASKPPSKRKRSKKRKKRKKSKGEKPPKFGRGLSEAGGIKIGDRIHISGDTLNKQERRDLDGREATCRGFRGSMDRPLALLVLDDGTNSAAPLTACRVVPPHSGGTSTFAASSATSPPTLIPYCPGIAAHGLGRGRGATQPAWMTAANNMGKFVPAVAAAASDEHVQQDLSSVPDNGLFIIDRRGDEE